MKLYRRMLMATVALAVAASGGVCFSQAAAANKKEIYSESADAHVEIKEALEQATAQHKRVIVVFGANWCYDCHVLDAAFHRADLAPILAANYEVVHVDIGRGEKNQDLMKQYGGSDEARHSRAGRARCRWTAGLQPEKWRIRECASARPGPVSGVSEQVETRRAEPVRI
jgi:thioredoxin-related protein